MLQEEARQLESEWKSERENRQRLELQMEALQRESASKQATAEATAEAEVVQLSQMVQHERIEKQQALQALHRAQLEQQQGQMETATQVIWADRRVIETPDAGECCAMLCDAVQSCVMLWDSGR